MRRLICPYPPNRKVDRVLKQLGEDFGHYDDIHNADNTHEAESESDANDGELADIAKMTPRRMLRRSTPQSRETVTSAL